MSALRSIPIPAIPRSRPEHPIAQLVEALQKRLGLDADFGTDESLAHVERVSAYSEMLARKVGIARPEASAIGAAARLHDIGKVAIPSSLLNRPGRLSPQEIQVVQTHTTIGHSLLAEAGLPDLEVAALIARSHHERWDGSGYPDGLAGDSIPESARIVAIADTFDALTTNRVYRAALPIFTALQIMEEGADTQFDPKLLRAFMSCRERAGSILEHLPDVH